MPNVDSTDMDFFEREDVPFASDRASWKCFRVFSDKSLKESPITLADLMVKGRAISKDEALRLAKAMGD
jgi:hypothetical protein